MSNYNTQLQSNNTDLQAILNSINELPEAGGVELPELTNEGTVSDLLSGKQLINSDGNVVTGTFSIDNEISTQDDLIAQLQTILDGKASGGEDVQLINFSFIYGDSSNPKTLSLQAEKDMNWGMWAYSNYNQLRVSDSDYGYFQGIFCSVVNINYSDGQWTPSVTLNNNNVKVYDIIQNDAVYYATYVNNMP